MVDKDHLVYRLESGQIPLMHDTAEKLRNVADMVDSIIVYSIQMKKIEKQIFLAIVN